MLVDRELAAQQAGDFAADRQAQAGAAVLAAGGAVGLLEGLEDDPLLVLRDADAGVLDREGEDLAGLVERSLAVSSRSAAARPQLHLAALGELEGVGEQVLEDLLQALVVGVHGAAAGRRVEVDAEVELLVLARSGRKVR